VPERGITYVRLTATGLARDGPALLYGLLLLVNDNLAYVRLDDDKGANSEHRFATVYGMEEVSVLHTFPKPVRLGRGLYVTKIGPVAEVVFLLEPLKLE
jgi:hypothetical protein